MFTDTFILQNCTVTSPSTGTIRVSCDSSHQILVTVTCTNCNNPNMVTSSGSSPLTVGGLDPGMVYSVMINVFDGNQVVLRDQTVNLIITVMYVEPGKVISNYNGVSRAIIMLKHTNNTSTYIHMYVAFITTTRLSIGYYSINILYIRMYPLYYVRTYLSDSLFLVYLSLKAT